MAVTQYFLGGNTVRGFVSFYSGFCRGPEDFLWVIKGGPGCGKSTCPRTAPPAIRSCTGPTGGWARPGALRSP